MGAQLQTAANTAVPSSPATPSLSPQWIQDAETGMLYRESRNSDSDFSIAKKKEFISIYSLHFPDLTRVILESGITRPTYYNHLKIDPVFRAYIEEIRQQKVDKVESKMFEFALLKGNFMDRIAVLRAHRPSLYMERKLNLTARDLEPSAALLKRQNLATVIDGELIGGPVPEISQPASGSPEPGTMVPASEIKENGDPGSSSQVPASTTGTV